MSDQYATLHEQRRLEAELESLEYRLSDRNLTLLPEYEQRLAVLKQLGYIDDTGAIQLKGRVACEVPNTHAHAAAADRWAHARVPVVSFVVAD